MGKFIRKANRLDLDNYSRGNIYFITACTKDKQWLLTNNETINFILDNLKKISKEKGYAVLAYCFMLDHLHLLIESNGNFNLIEFVKSFKQKTGFYYRKRFVKPLWQKSFYDRILRREESIKETIRYILNNPVRKGLVDSFQEYPFIGSFVFNLKELF